MRGLKVPCWKLLFFLGTGQRVGHSYEMFPGCLYDHEKKQVMRKWIKRLKKYDGDANGQCENMNPPPTKAEMKAGANIIREYLETCLEYGSCLLIG